ncbi:MAG TPA: reverse transcriptase-like protein [Actinomycetes bacterium]|nr:reverse transcriptase-like protein [Actinomycetes bacterium]
MSRRLIIEADGGSRGNPGPAAYGALVRDADTGEVLAERAEHIGRATNNVAEYRGLVAGLEAVREIDPTAQLEVRMDSRLVIEQMSGNWKIKHPDMVPLARRARGLLPTGKVTWTWVPRERNKNADRLLNIELDRATGRGGLGSMASPRLDRPRLDPDAPPATRPATPATGAAGSPAALVAAFHEAFDLSRQAHPDASAVPGDVARLRQDLLEEEVAELGRAAADVDVVAVARELADVVYVAYGTALTYGIDLDAVLAEVHRANMSKLGPDGRPRRRADGKVLKGDGFAEPDVAAVLGLAPPQPPAGA